MNKKILITGGAGFIGSHLVDLLVKKKFTVTVIDNLSSGNLNNLKDSIKKINFLKIDLSNQKELEKKLKNKSFDYCVHLAALADIVPSITNPDRYFNSNVVGTFNLLQIMRNKNLKKLIYSASSSCYGIPKKYPTSEASEINPEYPYAITKRIAEELIEHWGKVYKIPYVSLRFFNVYGPRSRTSGTYGAVFGVFLAQKIANKPFTVVGDGNQTRDFTYVSDIVNAIYKSLTSRISNRIINIGSGKTYSINYLVKLLGGKKVTIPKRPGEPKCTFANINLAKKLLKWKPQVSLEVGVKKVLQNIHYWNNAPLWSPSSIKKETKEWFKLLK